MTGFVVDVISSLVATALTVIGGWALSKRFRRSWTALLSRIAGLQVRRVYQRQELASEDLRADLADAQWIRVLTGRGNELTRDTFRHVWAGTTRNQQVVQVLLPDVRPGSGAWVAKREADIRRLDPGFSDGLLEAQIRANANYVAAAVRGQGTASLRFYNMPNVYRVIITDKVAYLTLYSNAAHGRHSPCIAASRPTLMYDLALSLFTTAWAQSTAA
jgi:hypothetical protein